MNPISELEDTQLTSCSTAFQVQHVWCQGHVVPGYLFMEHLFECCNNLFKCVFPRCICQMLCKEARRHSCVRPGEFRLLQNSLYFLWVENASEGGGL